MNFMQLMKIGFLSVTKNNLIDEILTGGLLDRNLIKVLDKNYLISKIDEITHLSYLPGFSSGISKNDNCEEIINDLNNLKFDTAILQFLDNISLEKFISSYFINNKNYYAYDEKQIAYLNIKDLSEEEILTKMKYENRRIIKKYYYDIKTKFSYEYDNSFHEIYSKRSIEKKYSIFYQFTKEDFYSLSQFKEIKYIGLSYDNEYLGGSFFRIFENKISGKRIDYLLTAINREKAKNLGIRNPSNLILWDAYMYGKKNNVSLFNLGGGIKKDDSLFDYKLNMGATESIFYRLRIINKNYKNANNLLKRINSKNFPR